MSDTSRRCVLNNAFQVLKPPCLQRVRCFAVVAAVFFIRGILNDPWLLGRPWRQESYDVALWTLFFSYRDVYVKNCLISRARRN